MSHFDLTRLSYKELQSLALQYKVPGNIKKFSLIKVLNAVRDGNEKEVSMLLADLKKNRKKKVKKPKPSENETVSGTDFRNQSADYNFTNSQYLFPQPPSQQLPYQWMGAEENTLFNRDSSHNYDCINYNDIRQFVNPNYENCDTNNNDIRNQQIIDLRTDNTVASYQVNYDINQSRQNTYQQQVIQPYNQSSVKSLLLKKMLQAPVGTNLGELVTPAVDNNFQDGWIPSNLQNQEDSIDNSDTLTAKSDNEFDLTWRTNLQIEKNLNTQYNYQSDYSQSNNYLENPNQIIVSECNLQNNQYTINNNWANSQEDYTKSWPISDYSDNREYSEQNSTFNETPLTYQPINYKLENSCSNNIQQGNNFESQNNIYYSSNDIPYFEQTYFNSTQDIQNESVDTNRNYNISNTYNNDDQGAHESYYNQLDNSTITEPAVPIMYNSILPEESIPIENPIYEDIGRQTNQTEYVVDQTSYSPQLYDQQNLQQGTDNVTPDLQNLPSQQPESNLQIENCSTSADILQPYWPKWSIEDNKLEGRSLENILNICSKSSIIHEKLKETCCVYTNKSPVMTSRKGFNCVPVCYNSSLKIAEERQHNFVSNWVLYNEKNSNRSTCNVSDGYVNIEKSFNPSLVSESLT